MLHFHVFAFALYCVAVSTGLQCKSPPSGTLKFSMLSRRNTTGHWIAQAQLQHGTERKENGPWEVDIDHTTTKCQGSETVLIVATISAPPQLPDKDYELLLGLGYYKLHSDIQDWVEAQKICVEEGTHLAIINSEQEMSAVRRLWMSQPKLFSDWRNNAAWIGIHDEYNEGEFLTIYGESLNSTGYMKWGPSEPNGGRIENCICINHSYGLTDVPCKEKLAFLCEKEL